MKKVHTAVSVWCIFNIGLGLLVFAIAVGAGFLNTIDKILLFIEIFMYGLALLPNSFAIITILILGILDMFRGGGLSEFGTYGMLLGILSLFLHILIFFIIKHNGQSAFQVSRNKNTTANNDITKKCPYCANEIKYEAIVCQFCNRDLN